MKKAICIAAIAAVTFSSVYAVPFTGTTGSIQQDTVKKKVKVKNGTAKIKVKKDTMVNGKTKMQKTKMKKDSVKTKM